MKAPEDASPSEGAFYFKQRRKFLMGPQCEDGYTKIANELFDALCRIRIPGVERQMFDYIIRKTYGYGKKLDSIPLSQFVTATGVKRQNVHSALKALSSKNMIVMQKHDNNFVSYGINKKYSEWVLSCKDITVSCKDIQPVMQRHSKVSCKDIPSKERKKTIKRKEDFSKSEDFQKTFDWFWREYALEEGRGRQGNRVQTRKNLEKSIHSKDDALKFCFAVKEYFRLVDSTNDNNRGFIQALKAPETFTNNWLGYVPEDAEDRLARHKEAKANATTE